MSEARLFSTNGFGGGLSAGIRADSYAEFLALAKEVYGEATGQAFAEASFAQLLSALPTAQAVANIDAQLGTVSVISTPPALQAVPNPPSTHLPNVVPMPTQPQAVQAQVPPTAPYPGDCAHGQRVYKNSVTKNGPWARYECALPWTKGADNSARCKAVSV